MLNRVRDRLSMALGIIKTYDNWPLVFLDYLGFSNKENVFSMRAGPKFKSKPRQFFQINDVWIRNSYTPFDDSIKQGDVIVDIGAHIGSFSIFAATKFRDTIVYAYEPAPENFKLLKENIKLNKLNNIVPYNQGIAGKRGTFILDISGASACYSIFPKQKPKKIIKINCITLKDIFKQNNINKIDFLKIDCEGAEFEILYNTPRYLFKKIDKIALEWHSWVGNQKELKEYLKKKEFKIKEIKESTFLDTGIFYCYK